VFNSRGASILLEGIMGSPPLSKGQIDLDEVVVVESYPMDSYPRI
jgi:hypothetical protein